MALACALWSSAFAAPLPMQAADERMSLDCSVAYLPERRTWHRQVELAFSQGRLQALQIDGQAPYTFQVQGPLILTALDNERIQIDVQTLNWTSDFRNRAQGNGRCEVEGPKPPPSSRAVQP